MLNALNNIRLGIILEDTNKPGKLKAHHTLEVMDKEQRRIMEALNLTDFHHEISRINGLGVYK